ncbi:MAG: hypothetical protein LBG52_05450 [Candidatus Peribacteria bacterium]|nr:hypothetical protein [Candidatus Peribacteria bacterium]
MLILLIALCVVCLGVGYYVRKFFSKSVDKTNPYNISAEFSGKNFEGMQSSGSAGGGASFEDGFYQDLSAFFGENPGYETIQGEYGFTTGGEM